VIHIYCGDGKGKTTAAMGLAVRMAGRGKKVLIAQFLKGADSGERLVLAALPQARLLPVPERVKFSWTLTEGERESERKRYAAMLEEINGVLAAEEIGLLVLDEVCAALHTGLVELGSVLSCLDLCARRGSEAVLTGREPPEELLERADYITEMVKVRHPYDKGVLAREGVER